MMAAEAQGAYIVRSWPAGEDLSDSQFYFVKLSSGTAVACDDVTDVPLGVLQNAPESGEQAEVCLVGPTKFSADAAIAAGALIGPSADGQAETKVPGTDTSEYICGRALEAATAAGQIIAGVVNCLSPARAA